VDENGRPVAHGQTGELCLGGLGLARGYCRSPELTAQKFTALGPSGERFYRTGDLAAWSADGDLLYYGRADDQMKIRGHRIDPGEVEAALQAHPGVRQAAATWFETASGSRSILAAIVPSGAGTVSARDLYDWLAQRLPGPMIPSRFDFCEALPQSPSGKIDRQALRKMAAAEIARPRSEAEELTPTERAVGSIWCAVLGRESVHATDHFFTIGGDSLSAVRVLTRLEADRGIDLPVQALFESPTLRAFAARLDRAGAAGAPPEWWKKLRRRWQGWFHPRPDVTAPADLLARQHVYVDPWHGHRHHRNGLVVTLNERGTRPGLFWCLQGYRELSQLAAASGRGTAGTRPALRLPDHGL
jgi:acyl carrier protein